MKLIKYFLTLTISATLFACGGEDKTWTYNGQDVFAWINEVNQDIKENPENHKFKVDGIQYQTTSIGEEDFNLVSNIRTEEIASTTFSDENFRKSLIDMGFCEQPPISISEEYVKYVITFKDNGKTSVKMTEKDCQLDK